ncbi:cysteine protease StiP domain-containing protein [uncultured Massilia sp.]|uniref:cysteine protease StiP domain-containing protein n=1 Tax=uncultured Massilia sp. TaxID=169973 RepID=UPI0025D73FA6|nr:cysteine protease StiP domain-containing protein [uncultured Massilia sp.]
MSFHGSYRPDDVDFLLRRLDPACQDFVAVAAKERLIQSGARHYSQMLSPESAPSARYMRLFDEACRANNGRMARDCLRLAALVARRRAGPLALVSLARAGTPVGVVVTRLLRAVFGRTVRHYSVSIVRDRGIDAQALRRILALGHRPEEIVFVDGWTGKGVIARELERTVAAFDRAHGTAIDAGLCVLSDLAGVAACAATRDDYLIPSSILNATVSGLVSRTVMDDAMGADDLHGCVFYADLAPHDRSLAFADALTALALARAPGMAHGEPDAADVEDVAAARERSRACIDAVMRRYDIRDANLVKPGIGEATRVLLRRVPRRVLLRDPAGADVAHLALLAGEKRVTVEIDPDLPYQAVSLIRSASDG